MKKSLIVFGIALSFSLLCGKEFFVSPAGNDNNPGTKKAPFATIGKAAKIARAGDTVKIGPGLYREQIVFRNSGKKGAPITFEGVRGKNGEFLTVVEGIGRDLTNWQKAPEIGPDVWKTAVKERPDLIMLDGKMIGFINRLTMALPRGKTLPDEIQAQHIWSKFGPGCKRCPGLDLLALKKDVRFTHPYLGNRKELFWPTIGDVLTGWHNGKLYIRFTNNSTPMKHRISASNGTGFSLSKASYLKFTNLHLRGSRCQIHMNEGSHNNVVDNCLLMHGGARIKIEKGAENNLVQNSILTAGFIRGDLFQLRSRDDMRGGVLYEFFKYIIGTSLSDDVAVRSFGQGTRVVNNVLLQGLIGASLNAPGSECANNVIMKMSSVGICTGDYTVGRFHHNLIMNCGIPIRIHDLRGARAPREEYHYKNLIIQAPQDGTLIYVHCESHRWGPDVVNFEKGTKIYKKNPPAPVDPGKFYIYHNTFWGGGNNTPGFQVTTYARRFRSVMPFVYVNNIVKGTYRWDPASQEMLAGNLLYNYPSAVSQQPLRHPEIKKSNTFIDEKASAALWNNKKIPGLYDVTLAKRSPAEGVGIDISKPFVHNGKKYAALPGFAPGYFKGKAPAAGALQSGENMEFFINLYRNAEKAVEIVKNAK